MAAPYSPKRAWQRAGLYFAACVVVAAATGVLAGILDAPLATAAQLADPRWLALSGACLVVIVLGYGVIWPMGTFTDGRQRHPLLAPAFGAVWGICQGLLFVVFWKLAERSGLGVWWVAAITYVLVGAYNGVWHRFVWDIYMSPPHNYTAWNGRKVLLCHTPNLLICLLWLALYGNFGLYVLLQGLALAISAYAMRFPAPWDRYTATPGLEK